MTNAPTARWRERLRRALTVPSAAADEQRGLREAVDQARVAAVLIPVVAADEPFIWLTERSDELRHHPGQISFPGGAVEPSDVDARSAALRETHEEIGLEPARVELLGELPDYATVSGFIIRPFVGWVAPDAAVAPAEAEVARLFGVPLAYVLDRRHFRQHTLARDGRRHIVFSIDYRGNDIWGATAGMLYGLMQRVERVQRAYGFGAVAGPA